MMQDLATLIQQQRERRGLSYRMLESRSGAVISAQRWQQLGTGVRMKEFPEPATLAAMAIALEVDVTSVVLSAASSVGLAVRDVRPGLLADSISVLSADDKYAVEVIVKSLSTSVSVVDDVVDDPDRPSS